MTPFYKKIAVAKTKFKEIKKRGLPAEIERLLTDLKHFIIEADTERARSGMSEICAECGQKGNACCAKGVEFKYSPELLLINLLYGVEITEQTEDNNMCYFLKDTGCSLFARDVFCINFICEKIRENIPAEKLKKLRELEGFQLDLQFRIEQIFKKFSVMTVTPDTFYLNNTVFNSSI